MLQSNSSLHCLASVYHLHTASQYLVMYLGFPRNKSAEQDVLKRAVLGQVSKSVMFEIHQAMELILRKIPI